MSTAGAWLRKTDDLDQDTFNELKKIIGKPIVVGEEMNGETKSEALDLIASAIDSCFGNTAKLNYETAAQQIKEQMDKKFGPCWHCLIGEGMGFSVTYNKGNMIYVYVSGKVAVLLFKS
mmetsp:Transcript_9478/g.13233  ORF Transcript_9478/g.13233 Transcript_9478/m.13233 type:complete len:119 (+) Transcript_9478:119-475(+)|eukprot:CAMPEP_0184487338 /NCGR_PEP_ID=MMETSP0113_2-20130426/9803_1 /TAXON_ID=91329 /ORGANISM="Norrisiella sphaerica, Strain BC52" /LENGTH=118 /DNA_ID=CAMNT_0026869601 /DNA_START=124 /DNA_END=480 /DNA_ORIENTATION=-